MSSQLPSPEELDQLSVVDPEIQARISQVPSNWQIWNVAEPEESIRQVRNVPMPAQPKYEGVHEHDEHYTTRDGAKLRLVAYKPEGSEGKTLPLLVWYHGGGGCLGSPDNQMIARNAVIDHGCVVVAPQYRLAPEFKYPYQVNDSWDALAHVAAHASDFGADPSKGFVLGGESAGAVIAAPLALKARDEPLPHPLTGVFLTVGSYFNPDNIPAEYKPFYRSRYDEACLNAPMLSKSAKAVFDKCMQGDFSAPMFKAALWPTGHADLPKTYMQNCGMDLNRDEGTCYADVLRKAGVEMKVDVYPGCPHCFWYLFPQVKQAQKWRQDTKDGLGWLFNRQ